jgi:hypothetical protein
VASGPTSDRAPADRASDGSSRYARRGVGNVVNLNRYRKRKRESEERARADAAAVEHGRTAEERERVARERELERAVLDGARRERPADPPKDDDSSGS